MSPWQFTFFETHNRFELDQTQMRSLGTMFLQKVDDIMLHLGDIIFFFIPKTKIIATFR